MGAQELHIQLCWPFRICVYPALMTAGIEDCAWPSPPDRTPGALNQKAETWIGLTRLNVGARSMAGGGGRSQPGWTMLALCTQTFCSLSCSTRAASTDEVVIRGRVCRGCPRDPLPPCQGEAVHVVSPGFLPRWTSAVPGPLIPHL